MHTPVFVKPLIKYERNMFTHLGYGADNQRKSCLIEYRHTLFKFLFFVYNKIKIWTGGYVLTTRQCKFFKSSVVLWQSNPQYPKHKIIITYHIAVYMEKSY